MRTIVSKPNSVTTKSEIINAKYLILQLANRDFFVRYRQTCLEFLWAVINPLTSLYCLPLFWSFSQNSNTRVFFTLFCSIDCRDLVLELFLRQSDVRK